ncbi:EF-Tu/IF-2/RF-3 family GTPase [Streptomyces sp. NPDC018019]|uniref:EF-Tu/IF-2/RF-3 family GTPase n=1 Tax=Streptomyces sp. NPDC018019 TaxID=3365030 RepID=UPI00379F2625
MVAFGREEAWAFMDGSSGQSVANAMEKPFLMPVEDVYHLQQGRVIMVTGRIERGRVRKGDAIEIIGSGGSATALVADIEQGRVRIAEAKADMNVGVLLRGVARDAVERGQVLATPGSAGAHVGFTADITLLSEEQGSVGVVSGDRLCFYIRTAIVWGVVTLPEGVDVVRPLHGAEVAVALEGPVVLEEGRSFAFRHRGRAAGSGIVTRLLCEA